MGYAMIAVLAAGDTGVRAGTYYAVAYVATVLLAFGTLVALSPAGGEIERVDDCRGLLWRRPALAVLLATSLLSLAGMPLTAGFIGKFYLVASAIGAGEWLLLGALIAGSAVSLFYYLRIIVIMLQGPPAPRLVAAAPGALLVGTALGAVLLAVLVLGVYPDVLQRLIAAAVGGPS
jgi:NADH-quinone oxidoreductase subunit N